MVPNLVLPAVLALSGPLFSTVNAGAATAQDVVDAIRGATTGRQRLQQACQFAKAVGDDRDDHDRTAMAREIAEIADRWNRQ